MKRGFSALFFLLVLTAAASCFRQGPDTATLRGTLLVWHTWPEPYGAVMDSLVDAFTAVNPNVIVVSEYVDVERLEARFLDQTAAGLGPDLILGASPALTSKLIEHDLLADLSTGIQEETWPLHSMDSLTVDGLLYAVPLAASTQVLFFNARLTEAVPQTLDALVAEARADRATALTADFYGSFWGIDNFGGQVEFERALPTVSAGLVEWLTWLQFAQREPNIIVTGDVTEARDLFVDGYAAYFIGPSTLLPELREELGEKYVGVALLPTPAESVTNEDGSTDPLAQLPDTHAPPGAFLELQVGVVSNVSTQAPLALALLGFMTNPVQQRQLAAADLGYAPLNRRVRFDVRMLPAESIIVQQSSVAPIVPLQDVPAFHQLQRVADDGYAQVLGGVLEPEEGAAYILRELRQAVQDAADSGT